MDLEFKIGNKIINFIQKRNNKKLKTQPGPLGDFFTNGGNQLLFDVPVKSESLIIDVGGYNGEWSSEMISRYGCKSEIFEPVPEFYNNCENYFKNNNLVKIHKLALGGADRKTIFNLSDNGTSEHIDSGKSKSIEVNVLDVSKLFDRLGSKQIACFKLNIEGAEYEVLERIISINKLEKCDSFLIQFHRQPQNYQSRYFKIKEDLEKTHNLIWGHEMVWEKWVRKGL